MYNTRRLGMFAPVLPLLIGAPIALCDEPSTASRIRGNYENKIRFFAAPEKIFETFATIRNDKGVYMSYEDFFYSLTPYNFTECVDDDSDEEEKKDDEANEAEDAKTTDNTEKPPKKPKYFDRFTPEIMQIVDADHDGKIDFDEYIFFITVLQLPEGEIMRTIEKLNPEERKVNKEQFAPELAKLRKSTALGMKQQNKTFMPDGRKITTNENMIINCIIEHLFQDKEFITIDDFNNLKSKLKHALLHYEFYQFEVDENETISAEDFAKSLLSCLTFNQAHKYMKTIHSLELPGRVSFPEYVAFHNLIEKADIIKMKIALYRYLSKGMFRELCDDFAKVDTYCKESNVSISDVQIDTFMKILDDDQNGLLEYEEVVDVLEGKKNIGLGKDQKFKNEMVELFDKYYKKFQKVVGWE